MNCPNCGKQLPEDANFCLQCGKPLQPGGQVQVQAPPYETCEIRYSQTRQGILFRGEGVFWARARGPRGEYNAGSMTFWSSKAWADYASRNDPAAMQAYKALVTKLESDGWERVPATRSLNSSGHTQWWNDHFRRTPRIAAR